MMNAHKTNGDLISIQGEDVVRIEYHDEPVVTFAMIDQVHQRPDGTAGRNFRENRERFVQAEDFIVGNLDEMRRAFPGAFPARGGGEVTLLTRRGYLKLTKPMNDDRAWAVQGEMVDRYFAVEQIAEAMRPKRGQSEARETRLFMKHAMALAKVSGLRGNQMLIAANRATRKAVGFDHLAEMGLNYLVSPDNDVLVNPTELGKRLGAISAIRVNHILAESGYQTGGHDAKGRALWLPTEKGIAAGGQMVDVERSNKTGQAQQLRWPTRMVDVLREVIAA